MALITIHCKGDRGNFKKEFDTVTEAQKFVWRCKYGHRITILSVDSFSAQALNELKI